MERRIAGVIYILITFALVNEISINVYARDNNKRRTKEKSGGFLKNICDITDRDSKVHCYCESTREPKNATKAECWVFNGGIPRDDQIWQSFASQPTLETLSFNIRVDGALSYIPTQALDYLPRLKSVNIKYGNIIDITSFAFNNLTNLKDISLSQNQIETLQRHSFAHLPNVTAINFEDNMITDIDAEAFFDVPNLHKLILTKNNISIIRNGTFQHTFNLLELDLNRNNIYCLNRRTFDGLANLKKLDLRKNRIQNLTEFTFAELWNLQELLLGKNDIKYISERSFDGLSQLRKLSLDYNKLTSLPLKLFEGVRGLSSLDLHSNELHALTFENILPIVDNLKPQSSNLILEENKFVCDCKLKWIHWLYNETKSQTTKSSLDGVTCKMDPPIVSSAYNKISEEFDNSKLDYNLDIFHASRSIEMWKEITNITEKSSSLAGLMHDNGNNITKKSINKSVLKIPPETLPCPQIIARTTDLSPYTTDPVKPLQNEMRTYRFYETNSSNQKIKLKFRLLVLWCICNNFLLT